MQLKLFQTPPRRLRHACGYALMDGSICPSAFRSRRALVQHMAIAHNSYARGDLASITLGSIKSTWEKALYLMMRFPACRKKDNGELYTKARYYFLGEMYDSARQSVVADYKGSLTADKQLDGFGRRKREIREQDRREFHAGGREARPHLCMLFGEAEEHLAQEEERVIHSYYAQRGARQGFVPHTFIPSGG